MSVRRPLLLPFVPLYRAAVALRHRRYDRGGGVTALQQPVVSVGSVSAGGAGKTPFLLALARLLQREGYHPDVLSRGYGRQTRGVLRVDPAGDARQFGDEPLMLARALGMPVYVGSSRHAAGRLAEAETAHDSLQIHLLDDGFSHRALARTLDIALLTLEDARDTLLPAGNLREPLEHLARADVLVLRAQEAAELEPLARRLLGPGKPIWIVTRRTVLPAIVPSRPIVFSGIARPGDFEYAVSEQGVHAAGVRRFRDHHFLTFAEVDALGRLAQRRNADGFLTTTKDAVKLSAAMLEVLQRVGPVAVADAVIDFQNPDEVLRDLRRALHPAICR